MLLNFIYKGEVYIIEESLPEFLQLAEFLQIRGLWKPPSTETVSNFTLPLSLLWLVFFI